MPTETTLGKIDTAKTVEAWVASAMRDDRVQRWQEARYPFLRAATVSRGGMEARAMCRDISRRGIGIVQSDEPPRTGPATVSIWLRNRVLDLPVDFLWVKRLGQGWWAAGGRVELSSLDYASLALSRIGTEIDLRLHQRHPFCHMFSVYASPSTAEDTFSFDPCEQQEDGIAISLNVSYGGIGLLSESYFEPQEQILQLHRIDDHDSSARIRGRVVSCRELPNGYYMTGVQFEASRIRMKDVFGDS